MKQIEKKSLSIVLATIVNLLWWIEWIAGAACIVLGSMAAYFRKGFALQIPIRYSPMTMSQIYPIGRNRSIGILNTTDGILSVHIDANLQNICMLLIGYGLIFSVIVTITYQLKTILQSIKEERPFQKANMSRIKVIALVLMVYSLVQWLFIIVVNQFLLSNFQFKHLDLTYDFNVSCFLIGIMLFVIEGIFKAGLLLEEEKQLTI